MPFRVIQSRQNARLKELRQAVSHAGRSGLAAIEGPNLVEEALRAGLRMECVFAAQGAEELLEPLRLPAETEVLLLPKALLVGALATETPQPVAALIEPPRWEWEEVFAARGSAPLVLVLAGLQDPGNLGTIVRSAEAFGASGVVSLPGTVSAWNSKAVRASAGSVFRVPVIAADERECFAQLRGAGLRVVATAVRDAGPAPEMDMTGGCAVIIGNEGNGVPEDLLARADARVTIPCPGPVESLNAAVAASVLLYEASRQRSGLGGGPRKSRGAAR